MESSISKEISDQASLGIAIIHHPDDVETAERVKVHMAVLGRSIIKDTNGELVTVNIESRGDLVERIRDEARNAIEAIEAKKIWFLIHVVSMELLLAMNMEQASTFWGAESLKMEGAAGLKKRFYYQLYVVLEGGQEALEALSLDSFVPLHAKEIPRNNITDSDAFIITQSMREVLTPYLEYLKAPRGL